MSTKELVIELRMPLPDDHFAQAETSLKAKRVVEVIGSTIEDEQLGNHTLTVDVVAKRGPQARTTTKTAAAPRRNKAANPAAAEAPTPANT